MSTNGIYHGGILYGPNTAMFKELIKWEKPPNWRPEDNPYPKMLYKAERRKDGIVAIHDPDDEGFGRRCQTIVNSPEEEEQAVKRGWRNIPDALDYYKNVVERAVSDAAAHRAYEDRNMSPAAQAEAAAAEGESPLHVPEIPEKPLVKRHGGWPKGKPRKKAS